MLGSSKEEKLYWPEVDLQRAQSELTNAKIKTRGKKFDSSESQMFTYSWGTFFSHIRSKSFQKKCYNLVPP